MVAILLWHNARGIASSVKFKLYRKMDSEEELYEHHKIVVDAGQGLLRIDKFLVGRLSNVTRSKVQAGLREGLISVNNSHVNPSYRVHPGDEISIDFHQSSENYEVIPEDITLDIVLEDEHLLIVNKPAGMVVHPAYQNWTGTLVNALAYHFQHLPERKGNKGRAGLVHRIDKDTSGLLVIAKTEDAMDGLAKQFFDHSIDRSYYALVWGVPKETKGVIDVNVGRSSKDRRTVVAFPTGDVGKRAITHYSVLKDLCDVALLQCRLETGRTHQIRAHMKYYGHPVFNDTMYGGNRILKEPITTKYKQFVQNCFKIIQRQALHANMLGFIHPITKKKVTITSDLPDDFRKVLDKWEHYVSHTKKVI